MTFLRLSKSFAIIITTSDSECLQRENINTRYNSNIYAKFSKINWISDKLYNHRMNAIRCYLEQTSTLRPWTKNKVKRNQLFTQFQFKPIIQQSTVLQIYFSVKYKILKQLIRIYKIFLDLFLSENLKFCVRPQKCLLVPALGIEAKVDVSIQWQIIKGIKQ